MLDACILLYSYKMLLVLSWVISVPLTQTTLPAPRDIWQSLETFWFHS